MLRRYEGPKVELSQLDSFSLKSLLSVDLVDSMGEGRLWPAELDDAIDALPTTERLIDKLCSSQDTANIHEDQSVEVGVSNDDETDNEKANVFLEEGELPAYQGFQPFDVVVGGERPGSAQYFPPPVNFNCLLSRKQTADDEELETDGKKDVKALKTVSVQSTPSPTKKTFRLQHPPSSSSSRSPSSKAV